MDADSLGEEHMGDNSKVGVYQIWHDQREPGPRIVSAYGGEQGRFPQDYAHVGNVEATGLHNAVEQTTGIGDFFLHPEEWQSWTVKSGTQALVPNPRDTWFGDVIVDPQGQPHRKMGRGGFEAIPAAERPGWHTMAEVGEEERLGNARDVHELDMEYHRGGRDPEQSEPPPIRDTTRNLVESVMLDAWPRNAAIVDFGIDSQRHYEALYYAIREGEITSETLDEALGHGQKLTELTRKAPSNPHKDVEFHTSWDVMFARERPSQGSQPDPLDAARRLARELAQQQAKAKDGPEIG